MVYFVKIKGSDLFSSNSLSSLVIWYCGSINTIDEPIIGLYGNIIYVSLNTASDNLPLI